MMTEIHRGDCTCDRCITELADAILGKPPTLAAIRRAKPWIMPADIPEEPLVEWRFINGQKLVFKGGSMDAGGTYRGAPEPMIADFSDEPTLIEEVPVDLQQKLDAVNARLAGLDKEEEQRAIERAKKALEELERDIDKRSTGWSVPQLMRAAAIEEELARPALDTDYEALGYPETAIGECDLESDCELAISAVRAAISCIEGSVVLRPWEPPSEKASL